jgi:DNA polymerase-3 subunit delta'
MERAIRGYEEIIGHDLIKDHLRLAVRENKVFHAYIFNGEDMSGKNMLAGVFAKTLVCEEGGETPCNHCKACHQFDSGSHPDVKYLVRTKASIGVDDIREQINRDVVIRPYSSRYKVYVIDEAEKMTEEAQNALLKTIEEPPAYAVIMLLTNNVEKMYSTIRSRCVTLNLRSVDQKLITSFLMEKHQVPDYRARTCSAYSQGNVGRAVQMASSERFSQMLEFVQRLVRGARDMKEFEIVQTAREMETFQEDIGDLLDLITLWYRDILTMKTAGDKDLLVFGEEYRFIRQKADKVSAAGIGRVLEAVETARERIRSNVNFHAAAEMLLLVIKEN